jgi:hypothetical protein
MASNVRSFNLALQRHAREMPAEGIQKIHRALALEALRGVVLMSPVDTGRFRGNWQQTTDEPATGTLETTDKSGGATIAKGAAQIAQIEPFSVSWLSNNLPYAARLENGYSKQAPSGMLSVTVARLRSWAKRVKL